MGTRDLPDVYAAAPSVLAYISGKSQVSML